jgi:hypothetical protein
VINESVNFSATERREENQNMHRQCEEGMKHGVATVVAWIYGSLELCSMDALTVFDEMLMTDICAVRIQQILFE